jgi:8-oxo-dGTP diphosphatase
VRFFIYRIIWDSKVVVDLRTATGLREDVKMATYVVVIAVVKLDDDDNNNDRDDCIILLLRRNAQRRTSPNKWQTPSGFMKEGESAEEAVLREVKEETALDGTIKKSGSVFEVVDEWARWIILPFLVLVKSYKVVIDTREHSEFKWVKVDEVSSFECVKGIEEDLKAVGLKKN